jgi:hypothetical protein
VLSHPSIAKPCAGILKKILEHDCLTCLVTQRLHNQLPFWKIVSAESFDRHGEGAIRSALRTRIKLCFFSDGSAPGPARFADNFNVQNAVVAQGREAKPYLIPILHYAENCTISSPMAKKQKTEPVRGHHGLYIQVRRLYAIVNDELHAHPRTKVWKDLKRITDEIHEIQQDWFHNKR